MLKSILYLGVGISEQFDFTCDDRYAREDTHYLLYIYDMMKIKFFSLSKESESSDVSLIEV